MVLGNCQADFGVRLKSAVLIHKYDIWRFEWVFERKENLAVIQALVEIAILWTFYGKVPSIYIVLERIGSQVFKRFFRHISNLLVDPCLTNVSLH